MTAPSEAPAHAWLRGQALWDLYYAIGYIGVGVLGALSGIDALRQITSAALLVALAMVYIALGRPLARREVAGWREYAFIAGLLVLFVPLSLTAGTGSFVLFVLCPQCFVVLRIPQAIVAVALLNVAPLVQLLGDTRTPLDLAFTIMAAMIIGAFSILLGIWTNWIITQSRERAQLIERLRDSQEEIARLSREKGTMAERERLAAEIHDTLAQGFTSLLMLIQAAESELGRDAGAVRHHLGLAGRTARENLDEARTLVAALRPTALASTSLDQALARLADRFGEETGVTAVYAGAGGATLAPATEVVLLRATQEALANVRKHAQATRVTVRLDRREGHAVLTVTDDGVGFDPADTPEPCAERGGYGLAGMRARVRDVGGTLTVHSARGEGTDVVAEVPW
jgi:signal transduction histidine kinase